MSERENIWVPKLKQYLADSKISRREFIRQSTLLGLSASAAYMWAGKITGQPIAPPARAQDLPRGGILKIGMRVPKVDSPHTYSWIYDSNISRQVVGYITRTGVDNVTRPICAPAGRPPTTSRPGRSRWPTSTGIPAGRSRLRTSPGTSSAFSIPKPAPRRPPC